MQEYINGIFAEKFGDELLGVNIDHCVPGSVFVRVRMKRVTPEMEKIAKAICEEFAEVDRDVRVEVVD